MEQLRSNIYSNNSSSPVAGQPYKSGDLIAGRYEINDVFGGDGQSSMGVVFKCYDQKYGQVLALKTLQDKFLQVPRMVENFKKEALSWIKLEQHPNIVRAYWVRELDGRLFVSCEFIPADDEGRNNLSHYLRQGLSLRQVLVWAVQFCHGMEYACLKNVSPHRDVKPDNIMISMDNEVKITDFGLSGPICTSERVVAGSPPWMAPEQFFGIADASSDVYSFGIVLYQAMTGGVYPFKPKQGETWGAAHKLYPVAPLPSRAAPLEKVIYRCLQKRRDKRYPDFASLRLDLESVFKNEVTKKTGERPPQTPVVKELKDAGLANKAMSFVSLGRIDEGINQYKESLKSNPESASMRNNLGNAYLKKGLFENAISEYKKAIKIDPYFSTAYFNMGNLYMQRERLDEAKEAFEDAIRANLEFAEAYVNLGSIYSKTGKIDEAIAAFRSALRINPSLATAYNKLGLALSKKELDDEAITTYLAALKVKPDNPQTYNNLGSAYLKKESLDDAMKAFGKALSLDEKYANAHYNIAVVFIKKEMPREAMYAFEQFIRYAGKTDARIKKAQEAVETVKKALYNK